MYIKSGGMKHKRGVCKKNDNFYYLIQTIASNIALLR